MKTPSKLAEKIKALPDSPGVYKFLDAQGRLLYVGKARRLKKRVASYFQPGRAHDARLEKMIAEVGGLEIIRASSEAEALIYEAGIIKDLSPKYNIELKDDKSYPYLKLTVGEKFPRLFVTRRRLNDGARYYGPYVNVKLLKEAVSFMKKVFPLRTCRNMRKTACLEYHIDQCAGPCEGKVGVKEYRAIVEQLEKFLEGDKTGLIDSLQTQMKKLASEKKYEKALAAKKRIEALVSVQEYHDRAEYPIYGELDDLKDALGLERLPVAVECFDISNISGAQPVGSMVRFVAGVPRKAQYRRFRIKNVEGIDDYSMIREVVGRRYRRLIEEKAPMPDLVIIDGGRGHLSVARRELDGLGLTDLPVASIAKEHNHLYSAGRRQPVRLSPGSRLLFLIQRIRDEAHRFAINYHRDLRSRQVFETGLRNIKGVGPAKERILLEKFGTVSGVREATVPELTEAGIDRTTASGIKRYFGRRG